MPFSIAGYLVGRVVGERQGITDDATLNRLSLLGGIMGSTPMGMVMTTVLAQREAENNAPSPTTTPPVSTTVQVEVPDVTDITFKEAQRKLESLGLTVARRELYSITTSKEHVIKQTPEPKAIVPQGTTVTLSVSLGSELPAQTKPPKTGSSEDVSDGAINAKKSAHSGQRG